MSELSASEYNAILRSDFNYFAQHCFSELNPQAAFAPNWHLEIIAAKLTEVRHGKIRRLIINMSHSIDFIEVIFHPTSFGRPTGSLDGSWVE
ncbi:MAG TPA: hypothetical protein VGK96_24970 [Candidatus Sulfotelmatobacter sp.]